MGALSAHYTPGGISSEGFYKVLHVGTSSLYQGSGENGVNPRKPISTLLAALDSDVVDSADRGTLIIMKRGHTENISAADFFSAIGSKKRITIRGEGDETDRPTLTWTAAAATWLLDTDSVVLENLNLNFEPGTGSVNVAAPMTISGNGCGLRNCKIRMGTDANNKVTVGLTITGDDCFLEDVFVYSATAAEATTFIRLTAADRLRMKNVVVMGATSATNVGALQCLTTESKQIRLEDCEFWNLKTASTVAVTGLASNIGTAKRCYLAVLSDNAAALTGAWATVGSMQFVDCRVTNLAGEAAATFGTVSA